jgi:hypothetical protein
MGPRNNVGRLGPKFFEAEQSLLAGHCEDGSEPECRIEGSEFSL